jgi:hypothetical protein
VLTRPWPESLYAFAPDWALLSGHACLFAVDLPGFGESECQLMAEADLGAAHIVVPDVMTAAAVWGGEADG